MKNYFQAPWSIKDFLKICFSIIILAFLTAAALNFVDLKSWIDVENKTVGLLLGFLLQWIIILAPLLIITSKKYNLQIKHFGVEKVKISTTIWEILKSYLLFLGISFLIGVMVLYYDLKIPGYQVQENIVPAFGDQWINLAIAGVVIIIIAPLMEELFFRGFLLRKLSDRLGIFFGSVISAFIFALAHFPWQSIIPIFILGLIINSIVIRTKSIIPAIFFHVFNNAVAFTLEVLIIKDVISIENLA